MDGRENEDTLHFDMVARLVLFPAFRAFRLAVHVPVP